MEPSQHIVTLASLRRLRWLTLAVLVLLSVATQLGWGPEASPAGIAGVLAVLFGAQLALWWWPEGRAGRHAATAVLTLDGLCLTTAFALTDGSATPYAFLYLFPVVLAGLVLPGWRSILVLAACTVGYASLFVIAPANLHHHDHQAMLTHMYGMFVAYALTAVLIVAAMARMGRAQAAATEALMRAQDLQARTERVGSLATLAAGASHQLANPLSTILMVASELRHKATDDAMREDLDLIGDEVARCRDILGALSAETAAGAGQGAQAIATSSLATGALEASPDVVVDADDSTVVVPVTLVHQVIRRLVENARQAGSRRSRRPWATPRRSTAWAPSTGCPCWPGLTPGSPRRAARTARGPACSRSTRSRPSSRRSCPQACRARARATAT